MCNKLANRHVRVGLADPIDVPRCDICENEPGMQSLFFCHIIQFRFPTTKVSPVNLASSIFLLRDRWKFSLFAM